MRAEVRTSLRIVSGVWILFQSCEKAMEGFVKIIKLLTLISNIILNLWRIVVVVQSLSHVWLLETLWTAARQLLCPPLSPRVCSNSCPLSWWCYPTISSSVTHFSFYLQSFPSSGSFPMSWLFAWGGQSIGVSESVIPMNIQDWLTGLISSQSKGLSRVFSNTTICKLLFFGAQPSLWSNSHVHT